jgi:AmiR/NasT family two-component response regulator
MSAFTSHELVAEARRASALAVLPKPLEIDRVLTLLERAAAGGGWGEDRT